MKLFLCVLMAFALSACSIQISKGNTYQEPLAAPNIATLHLKNKDFLHFTASELAYMPNNNMAYYSVDGRRVGFFQTDTLRILSGKHDIVIACRINNRTFDQANILLNARPGRTYEISYPDDLYGYTIDYQACQKIKVSQL